MGVERDIFNELTGVSRLLTRLRDYRQRDLLSPDEWCVGMLAFALAEVDQTDLPGDEFPPLCAQFARRVPPETRLKTLARLAAFVVQRRGEGWRALLLYAVGEPVPAIAARAATLAVTLAPPTGDARFAGLREAVQLVASGRIEAKTGDVLSGLLAPADTRLLPDLLPLHSLPPERLGGILRSLHGKLNSLSADWLLPLAQVSALQEDLTLAFEHLAASTDIIADVVYPIPTWNFASSKPEPLHAWTRSEFFARIRPRIEPYLPSPLFARIISSFT